MGSRRKNEPRLIGEPTFTCKVRFARFDQRKSGASLLRRSSQRREFRAGGGRQAFVALPAKVRSALSGGHSGKKQDAVTRQAFFWSTRLSDADSPLAARIFFSDPESEEARTLLERRSCRVARSLRGMRDSRIVLAETGSNSSDSTVLATSLLRRRHRHRHRKTRHRWKTPRTNSLAWAARR